MSDDYQSDDEIRSLVRRNSSLQLSSISSFAISSIWQLCSGTLPICRYDEAASR